MVFEGEIESTVGNRNRSLRSLYISRTPMKCSQFGLTAMFNSKLLLDITFRGTCN